MELRVARSAELISSCFAPRFAPFAKGDCLPTIVGRGGFCLHSPRIIVYNTVMIPYNSENLKYARKNRRQRNATRQEGILWHCYLKTTKVHFYRQYRVGSFILDFYCPKKKLAIEIDGGQHYDDAAMIYDRERTLFLQNNGVTVLRFTNDDVNHHLSSVIERIRKAIEE